MDEGRNLQYTKPDWLNELKEKIPAWFEPLPINYSDDVNSYDELLEKVFNPQNSNDYLCSTTDTLNLCRSSASASDEIKGFSFNSSTKKCKLYKNSTIIQDGNVENEIHYVKKKNTSVTSDIYNGDCRSEPCGFPFYKNDSTGLTVSQCADFAFENNAEGYSIDNNNICSIFHRKGPEDKIKAYNQKCITDSWGAQDCYKLFHSSHVDSKKESYLDLLDKFN